MHDRPVATLPLRILITESFQLYRAGLRCLIEAMPGLDVIAEARDSGEAFEMIALHRPELALLELPASHSLTALQAISRISAAYAETALVVLSASPTLDLARDALGRGARAFIGKDSSPVELELALQTAAQGHIFLSPALSSKMVHQLLRPEARRDRNDLTPRQRQILGFLAQGQTSKQIAAELGLSVKTVETHRARMMESLGLRRASELLRYALSRSTGNGPVTG